MKIDEICNRLSEFELDDDLDSLDLMTFRNVVDILRECVASGFVTPDGVVRKVLGTLPVTADGCIIGNNAETWFTLSVRPGRVFRDKWYTRINGDEEDSFVGYAHYATREAAAAAKGKL